MTLSCHRDAPKITSLANLVRRPLEPGWADLNAPSWTIGNGYLAISNLEGGRIEAFHPRRRLDGELDVWPRVWDGAHHVQSEYRDHGEVR